MYELHELYQIPTPTTTPAPKNFHNLHHLPFATNGPIEGFVVGRFVGMYERPTPIHLVASPVGVHIVQTGQKQTYPTAHTEEKHPNIMCYSQTTLNHAKLTMVLPLLHGCRVDAAQIPNLLFLELVPDRQSLAGYFPRLRSDVFTPLENGLSRSEPDGKPTKAKQTANTSGRMVHMANNAVNKWNFSWAPIGLHVHTYTYKYPLLLALPKSTSKEISSQRAFPQ